MPSRRLNLEGKVGSSSYRLVNLQTTFRSHPSCKPSKKLTIFYFLRNTEIGYLNSTFVVDENIGTFNITVDNISLVKIVQALKNLANEIFDQRLLESSVISQKCRHRTAGNIFEENVEEITIERRVCVIIYWVFSGKRKRKAYRGTAQCSRAVNP